MVLTSCFSTSYPQDREPVLNTWRRVRFPLKPSCPPNSIIIQSNISKSGGKAKVTPTKREGRKLDVLGQKLHSLATFLLRVANYQAAMGAYQKQLWTRVLPALEAAPEDSRALFLSAYSEALTVAKHQRLASRHSTDVASKSMTSAIGLWRHARLRSSGITEDAQSHIEDLPFDATGLFNEKTNDKMENLHKIKKTAKSYTIQQQPKYQRYQWPKPYKQQQFQPSFSQAYGFSKQHGNPRSSQTSSAAPPIDTQASSLRRHSYRPPGRKTKRYL